ncbi:MAG: SAM-dependent methyltransferase [Anaerolineae bacterium]|nr:SAM-dependent methyltransferase [Anaerolineae bacterium]
MTTYQVSPVGHVRQIEGLFAIEILPEFRPALKALEQFSHVHVFWWMSESDNPTDRANLQDELPYAPGQIAGVFASRSNERPNPIGLTTCFILDVDEKAGMIYVAWMDAHDGTTVLDLKPYIPLSDRARDVKVPSWFAGWPQWMEDAADFDFASVGLGDD